MRHIDTFKKLSDGSLKNYLAKWGKFPNYTEKRQTEDRKYATPATDVPRFWEEEDDESMAVHVTLDGKTIDRFLKTNIHEFTLDSQEEAISRTQIQELYDLVDDDALIVQIINNVIYKRQTVTEFCKRLKISRDTYYKHVKEIRSNPALKKYLESDPRGKSS
jgi:hypothetical protein